MSNCLFCKIAAGEIPANIVFQHDDMVVFHDIAPKAPTHLLVIPRKHIENLNDLAVDDQPLIGRMMAKMSTLAQDQGLTEGYRVITNTGLGGGQEVYHLHFHLIGDIRQATWKGF